MQQSLGDGDTGRSYMPLVGVAEAQVSVVAVGVPEGMHEDDITQVIARVELRLVWESQIEQAELTATEGEEPEVPSIGSAPPITYDILVTEPFSGAPKVVSWGGPGSGPTLTPYSSGMSGISDLQFVAPPSAPAPTEPVPSQEPSESPSPSGSGDKEDND